MAKIAQFNLTVTITTGMAAFVLAAAAIGAYVSKREQGKSPETIWRENIEFISAAIGVAAGVTSASYVGENLSIQQRNIKIERSLTFNSAWTYSVIPTFFKEDVVNLLEDLDKLEHGKQAGFISTKFDETPALEQSIIAILNHLENLAISVRDKHVDEQIVRDYYRNIVARYYTLFASWIHQLRRERSSGTEEGSKYYRWLEELYGKWCNS